MEDYAKLLDMLIADYEHDRRSKERSGALAALYEARKLLSSMSKI